MDAGCHYTLNTLDATNYTHVKRQNGLFSCLFVFSWNYKHFQREKRGENCLYGMGLTLVLAGYFSWLHPHDG